MRNLLDTHTVLWFLNGEKMSEKVKKMIICGENYISVVLLWEVVIKMNIGKYTFNGGFSKFRELVRNNGFSVLPIKDDYLEQLLTLPLIHKDPFDRLLISTALTENLTIITIDENIHKYEVKWEW